MLYEAPPFYMINGVSIMPDHADPLQYYYMPLAPRFVTRKDGHVDIPQLLIVKYRSETRNGGLADFDVHLGMSEAEHQEVWRELRRLSGTDDVRRPLPVPVVDGGVTLTLFGGKSGEPAREDESLVPEIHHAAKPALYGEHRAAFSVELSQEDVTKLDAAIRGELSPIGITYRLDYLALRPAYHVKLSINWDRVQEILDTTYGHEGLFTDIQIQDTVEKLIDQEEIRFEVDTFVTEDEGGTVIERRDAATARVRDMITSAFFESSLDPLHEPPDGWDKAARTIKSFSPQRVTGSGVFSYRKTHYKRMDSKQLDVNFSERTTIKRSIYPQGHLSGMFRLFRGGLDSTRFIISVNADDPWFKRRKVRVHSLADFAGDPVRSITASLTYGNVTKTILLDSTSQEAVVEWPSVVSGGEMLDPIMVRFDVALKPADAGEWPHTLRSPSFEVRGETTDLEPRQLFSLEKIPILTLDKLFPWDRYPRVDVRLRYEDPQNGIRQDEVVRLTKDTSNSEWRRFLVGAPAGPIMAKIIYRAADHGDRELPFTPLTQPQVDVADPFPQRLKVSVVPALDFKQVDRAFVDIQYADPQNHVHKVDSIEIAENTPARPFIVDRVDPMLGRVRYKVTILMKDSTLFEGPWSTTLSNRIFVRPDLKGHRVVTLRFPADSTAKGLERMVVEARSKDELAGLSFADRFDFTAPGSTATFEFDFVDPASDAYELKVKRLFKNGMSAEQDWQRFDVDDVTLLAT